MKKYYPMLSLLLAVALAAVAPIAAAETKSANAAQEPEPIKAEVVQAEPDAETPPTAAAPKPIESAKTAGTAKTAEAPAAKSVESSKAAEAAKPAEAAVKTAETADAAKTIEPAAKLQAAAAAAQEPAKHTACAQCILPLTEAYRQAYEGFAKWTQEVNTQTADAEARVQKLQDQILQNEAATTKLRIEGGKENKSRIKELSKENKQLWNDLKTARKDRASLCQEFAKTAAQRVKQHNADVNERLKETQSQMKSAE